QRRSHPDAPHEWRTKTPEDAKSAHRDILSERVGHQINLVPEGRQRADPMELAERRSAWLEKRFGCDHQNTQDAVIFSRNRSTVASPLVKAIGRTSAGFVAPAVAAPCRQNRRERRAAGDSLRA